MLFVLEGGYSLRGLTEGVGALLAGITAPATAAPAAIEPPRGSVLEQLIARSAAVHGTRIPEIG